MEFLLGAVEVFATTLRVSFSRALLHLVYFEMCEFFSFILKVGIFCFYFVGSHFLFIYLRTSWIMIVYCIISVYINVCY